jgi:apolipoprotein N-acyltransferase
MDQSRPVTPFPRLGGRFEPHGPGRLRGYRGDLLALLAGALLPLAFAPFHFFPLAIAAPAVLFLLWQGLTPRRAFRRGYLFGVGMFGVGVSWVFVSMYDFGGIALALSLFLTALFVLFLCLFPALLGYGLARLGGRAPPLLRLALLYPAGWVLFEWIRGWFLTGFPWLLLGYSQTDTVLAGWAPVSGVYGVSLAVALCGGWLAALVHARGAVQRMMLVTGVLALWGSAALLQLPAWTRPTGEPLRVTLLQGNIPQDIKWLEDVREPTLELYSRLTAQHWDSRLIVWPESAVPAMYHDVEHYLDRLAEQTRRHDSELLVGVLYDDLATGRYYNSIASLGDHRAFYHKHHLVPFTEYLPMQGLLGGIVNFMQVPMSDFSKGPVRQPPLAVAGQWAGISICYEDAFGEEVIKALPKATFLVNVSDDAWFGHSIAPRQHLQIARMRALETGRPLLRATNTGVTAIIGPHGRIQAEAPPFKVAALTGEIQPRQGMTPYARTGNAPVVILIAVMLAAGGFIAWRRGPAGEG